MKRVILIFMASVLLTGCDLISRIGGVPTSSLRANTDTIRSIIYLWQG